MEELLRQTTLGTCENRVIEEKMLLLLQRLQNTGVLCVVGVIIFQINCFYGFIILSILRFAEIERMVEESGNDVGYGITWHAVMAHILCSVYAKRVQKNT